MCLAGVASGSRAWVVPLKPGVGGVRAHVAAGLPVTSRVEIAGPANGVYCGSAVENGVGVHDLGGLPAGLSVTVTIEPFTENFHPAAAVLVATLGAKAAGTVQLTSFYDDEAGDVPEVRVSFVTPQNGTYVLLVNDFDDAIVGCYRYQVSVQ